MSEMNSHKARQVAQAAGFLVNDVQELIRKLRNDGQNYRASAIDARLSELKMHLSDFHKAAK